MSTFNSRKMKRPLLLFFIWYVSSSNAQRIAMVDIEGHRDSFIERFETKLGFQRIEDENKHAVLRGQLNGESADLIVYETPLNASSIQGRRSRLQCIYEVEKGQEHTIWPRRLNSQEEIRRT